MTNNQKVAFTAIAVSSLAVLSSALSQPVAAERKPDLKKGERVFENAGCIGCHAGGGNEINPKKPIRGSDFFKRYADDEKLIAVIRSGVRGTAMPPTDKKMLSDADMSDLVAYIRSLSARK